MQCPKCGKEIKDESIFCSFCGAEISAKQKKMTFVEKREAKEKERQEILSKAVLKKEDVENLDEVESEFIQISNKKDFNKEKKKTLIKCIIEAFAILAALVSYELVYYLGENLAHNIKFLLIGVIFVVLMGGLAFIVGDIYAFNTLNKMGKSDLAIKKINYGKNPLLYKNGKLYEVFITKTCNVCSSSMHIEEYDGAMYAVCDKNREHILKIDNKNICNKIDEN